MIKVLFFAQLKEYANTDTVQIPIGDMRVVRDLLAGLQPHVPANLISALSDESALVSINQSYAGWDAELEDGVEIGFLPPVSGG